MVTLSRQVRRRIARTGELPDGMQWTPEGEPVLHGMVKGADGTVTFYPDYRHRLTIVDLPSIEEVSRDWDEDSRP